LDRLTVDFGEGARRASPVDAGALAWSTSGYDLLWREAGSDTALRGTWNDQKGRGPRPLVLLSPSSDPSKVRVCGPQHPRPIRELPFEPVLNVLREAAELHFNEAGQTLAREFIRFEEAAIPGLRLKELLTPHFVRQRLRGSRPQLEEAIADVTPADSRDWRSLFRKLGYQVESLPLRGHLLRDENEAPVAVVHPSNDPESFGQLTKDHALPEGVLLADCERHGADWGVLAASGRYRLFQRRPESGAAGGQYLEIDAYDLTRDSRYCLGLLSPESLQEDGWLEGWAREARDFGEELRKGLEDRLIRDVLPSIARGLGEHLESEGIDSGEPEQLVRIGEAALTLVFRYMFLLHVEARGYLPVNSPVYSRRSATSLARECHEALSSGPGDKTSTRVWDDLRTLVGMIRRGDTDAGVPAYNGQLFAADGFPGSELLEQASITNAHLAPALDAIAYDTDRAEAPGLDYAGLQVGHLGAIYEALLSMKLSSAPEDLIYDKKRKVYRPARGGEESEVTRRDLFYQSEKGDRKAGGVFYTRQEFVRHLLKHSLEPALDDHLAAVRKTLERDPDEAARMLFDFSVLDPAMGSAHFLTVALDVMADRYATFLADVDGFPGIKQQLDELRRDDLPGVRPPEDGELMRRLILKRCIYGVDISPMAVEVANITLWLASFVPGLALSWLDGNLKCGNSLIGVADAKVVERGERQGFMFSDPVREAMDAATAKQRELESNLDLTPEDVQRNHKIQAELDEITADLRSVFDLWAAEPLGLDGARRVDPTVVMEQERLTHRDQQLVDGAISYASDHSFFHWPLEFPGVFHRDKAGFDVVVGNPPWEEVKLEKLGFYALRAPGLHGISDGQERRKRIAKLDEEHPDWREVLHSKQEQLATARSFLSRAGSYELQGGGDTDLYQLFCERYTKLVRQSGRLGVVLPRSALVTQGAEGFRQWLLGSTTVKRIDVIKNSKMWAFPITAQYTIALLTMHNTPAQSALIFQTTGPSASLSDFKKVADSEGIDIRSETLGSSRLIQTQPSQRHADILSTIRRGTEFKELQIPESVILRISPSAASHVTPYRELDATQQKGKFEHPQGEDRVPVWRGMSFHQYDPHGDKPAGYADWKEIAEWTHLKRSRAHIFKRMFSEKVLRDASSNPMLKARIAYRAINRATDPRTIVACLVPPRTPLTNAAPYLLFRDWETIGQSAVIAVLNSIPFDWQARMYVEMNINMFILNMLCFPHWDNIDWRRIGSLAARLSCVDDRFADFAAEAGVDYGALTKAERDDMRAEIDALVAQGYGLDVDELRFIFTDFTLDAVPEHYRDLVVAKFEAL
jgi:hypothetical protein